LRNRISLLAVQVIFILAIQFTSLIVLWFLNPLTQAATDTFALYLSLNMVAFAIISYIYRSRRNSKIPSPAWMAIGFLVLIVLLVSNLTFA
jgi:hypothetical protein